MSRSALDVVGAAPVLQRAILVRVRNARDVAAKQGGIASLAASVAPATVEAKVYEEMAKRMQADMRANGIDADVAIVSDAASAPPAPAAPSDARSFVIGTVAGIGMCGIGYAGWRLFRKVFGG